MSDNIEVQVDVSGALARLNAVATAASDLRPVFEGPINQSINEVFTKQFATEGSFGGKKWAPQAPVTKLLRQRRGHGRGGILRDENRLWASLTKLGLGPDAVKIVTKGSIIRGTSVPYGKYHQTGYVSKTFVVVNRLGDPVPLRRRFPKNIPARPIIPDPMPNNVVRGWEDTLTKFIVKGAS